MRSALMSFLMQETALTDIIPEERWVSGRDLEDRPPTPFAVLRFGGTFRCVDPVRTSRMEIWVHDEPGNYDLIDEVIKLVYNKLHKAVHISDAEAEIVCATWVGDSIDLYDPALRTNTKSTGYDLVGKNK